MGFTGYDDVINAVTVNERLRKVVFTKKTLTNPSTGLFHTLWKATGIPAAGGDPVNGMAGAVATSSANTGALLFTNASGGRTMHLAGMSVTCAGKNGTLILVDRLAHANINNGQATASFSPVIDGTARLNSGEGGMIVTEVTSALSASTSDRTFTYTNQAGTGGKVTPTWTSVVSAPEGRTAYLNFFIPLAAGDTGVRSIESTTFVGGGGTGAYNICLVKVLAMMSYSVNRIGSSRDYIVEIPLLQQIKDSACMMFYIIPGDTVSSGFHGEVRLIEN